MSARIVTTKLVSGEEVFGEEVTGGEVAGDTRYVHIKNPSVLVQIVNPQTGQPGAMIVPWVQSAQQTEFVSIQKDHILWGGDASDKVAAAHRQEYSSIALPETPALFTGD
jgi:hypothetical protein